MGVVATMFSSKCPRCHRDRQQRGYRLSELTLLLKLGIAIEACCIFCNERWVISTEEQTGLSRTLYARK